MSNESISESICLAGRTISTRIARELSDCEISRGEYRILSSLYQKEGISQTDLSDQYHLDKGVITRVVKRLEEKGFIERRRNSTDQRRKLLYLTPKSKEIHQDVTALKRTLSEEITAGLTDEEIETLVDSLQTVNENLGAGSIEDR